jgi:hypothetical protein
VHRQVDPPMWEEGRRRRGRGRVGRRGGSGDGERESSPDRSARAAWLAGELEAVLLGQAASAGPPAAAGRVRGRGRRGATNRSGSGGGWVGEDGEAFGQLDQSEHQKTNLLPVLNCFLD